MSRVAGVWAVLALAVAPSFAAEASAPGQAAPRAVAESFASLTFDFCAAVVARSDSTVFEIGRQLKGFRWEGPRPVGETGAWSQALQAILRAEPDTLVYKAITQVTSAQAFHVAYARADGKSCVVVAQKIPDVATLTVTRLETEGFFHLLQEEKGRRVFGRPARKGESGVIVNVPADTRGDDVVDIALHRDDVRPYVSDARLGKWVRTVVAGCRASVDGRRPITPADFGGLLEEKAGEDGSVTLQSADEYPAAILHGSPAPRFGCDFMLHGGHVQNRRVMDGLLAELSLKPGVREADSRIDERHLIDGAGAHRAMSIHFRDQGFIAKMVLEGR